MDCGVCDHDVSTGTERAKRLKLSGKMAIETKDQIDCFLCQEYGMRICKSQEEVHIN